MKIYNDITEIIGKTPLVRIDGFSRKRGIKANILVKLEYLNPAGSVKDRVAAAMIDDAESKGLIKKGAVIIEPTSGNTGIGLAAVAASRGYKVMLTMPDTMSIERRKLLAAYGAEIVLTDGKGGMSAAIDKANELAKSIPGSFIAGQFENPANPEAHYKTTGPEIWQDTDGKVDFFVAGVGTGGTLTGVGKYLKSKNPEVKVTAVEPASSPLLSKGMSGAHGLQGIGANFVPSILDKSEVDLILPISDEDAFDYVKWFYKTSGEKVGISSGATLAAAELISERTNGMFVAILADGGDRYSDVLYE